MDYLGMRRGTFCREGRESCNAERHIKDPLFLQHLPSEAFYYPPFQIDDLLNLRIPSSFLVTLALNV